jgi:hypothetical protein
MPPWLPEPGLVRFANERRLSDDEIGILGQWFEEGAIEGSLGGLPAPPNWTEDWQLGPPDLVLTMARSYELAAQGREVYRNFVIPVPISEPRYVRAVELNPATAESSTTHSSK